MTAVPKAWKPLDTFQPCHGCHWGINPSFWSRLLTVNMLLFLHWGRSIRPVSPFFVHVTSDLSSIEGTSREKTGEHQFLLFRKTTIIAAAAAQLEGSWACAHYWCFSPSLAWLFAGIRLLRTEPTLSIPRWASPAQGSSEALRSEPRLLQGRVAILGQPTHVLFRIKGAPEHPALSETEGGKLSLQVSSAEHCLYSITDSQTSSTITA